MKLKMFLIYDTKAEAYNQPFFLTTRGQAIRAFSDNVNDSSSSLSKHSEDYTLFEVGEYDDQTGDIIMNPHKESLGLALQFKEQNDTHPKDGNARPITSSMRQGATPYNQ